MAKFCKCEFNYSYGDIVYKKYCNKINKGVIIGCCLYKGNIMYEVIFPDDGLVKYDQIELCESENEIVRSKMFDNLNGLDIDALLNGDL